jgi:predicted house-cleaning noncanonical NTP pyrophosphatase (MazG superfamily)
MKKGNDMQNLVKKILRILKDHVSQNNQEIQYNQDEINRLLSAAADNSGSNDLEYKNALNKELLEENEEFIQMQLQISDFMEKYGHLFPEQEDSDDNEFIEQDEGLPYFTKTVSGQLDYGPEHPQFHNIRFFNELLKYYQDREDYERCDQLIRIKKYN